MTDDDLPGLSRRNASASDDDSLRVPGSPVAARALSALRDDDRAASPTVGAVLLVGVTVLLATAVGGYLFGLAGGQQSPYATATVEFSKTENRVTVTWMANANADELTVRVQVGDERRTVSLDGVGDRAVVDEGGVTVSSGSVGEWKSPTISDGDRVTVTVVAVTGGERVVIADRSEVV
ncbi:type IV pilin (plasmid) [Halorussus limi]|uniref:Type IV pilin n=1 Tax=Halorussus limi TaxID=2938695 RepID=A0A8U0HZG1_9EURY|nr:type IV pilin [Halorussus limi]UPV76328.1 type IV pilin [Halorussus limi]